MSGIARLRQDMATYIGELRKASIEGHDFESQQFGEGCKVGIIPELGGVCPRSRQRAPERFDSGRLINVAHTRIGDERVMELPGLEERDSVLFPWPGDSWPTAEIPFASSDKNSTWPARSNGTRQSPRHGVYAPGTPGRAKHSHQEDASS